MYLTGFADEAGADIDVQIKATKELGWKNIECRNVKVEDRKANLHDISDADFDVVCGKLKDAGVKVNCFGSAIANWGKKIEDPFEITVAEVKRAIPRMKKLGSKLIRIMSYAVCKDRGPEDQMVDERVRRLKEMLKMFHDAGVEPVHENCMNYGGMGWKYTLELIEKVPGLKLVFDTCNPLMTKDYAKGKPYPLQGAWEFYDHVKDHVEYIHIKDAKFVKETEGIFPEAKFTWPGDGDGDVKKILADLFARGYDGGISIEPHLGAVFHDPSKQSTEGSAYDTYVEYGRRMEKLIREVRG